MRENQMPRPTPGGHKIHFTGVLIQDPDDKGFTAYLAEMPEVIAEGDTEEEVVKNLLDAFTVITDFKRTEAAERLELEGEEAPLSRSISLEFNTAV